FDALGMALGLVNEVEVQPGKPVAIEVSGEGARELSNGPDNLVYHAIRRVAERLEVPAPAVRLCCRNAIPLARGLGSSSAAIVAGLLAGNHLYGGPLSTAQLLDLAVEIEGHPDNVTPALLGGLRVCVRGEVGSVQTAVSLARPLEAVLFVPDF